MKERVAKARNEGPFTPPGLTDTISMPGNQGGANWGTTGRTGEGAGVRRRGQSGRDPQARGRDTARCPRAAAGGGRWAGVARGQAGFLAYQQYCTGVPRREPARGAAGRADSGRHHGSHRRGRHQGGITGGKGNMRPRVEHHRRRDGFSDFLPGAVECIGWPGGRGVGRGGGPPVELPPGPVVASGGAPQPPPPPRFMGPFYPGIGGNAGNLPYPAEVKAALPETRYMTDYGVLASFTKPPYTTLTAYDLNTGEIKLAGPQRRPPADDGAGGPSNTGGVGARYGIVVTKAGWSFMPAATARCAPMTRTPGRNSLDRHLQGQHQRRSGERRGKGPAVLRDAPQTPVAAGEAGAAQPRCPTRTGRWALSPSRCPVRTAPLNVTCVG